MTLLEIARSYVAKGLSVIPLVKRDKIPDGDVLPGRSWKVYQERRATDAELVTWFQTGERNIGIVTGSISGFVVVDLDGPEGISVAQKLGISSPLTVVTGRVEGGRHLYFRHPGGSVGNGVKIAPGIDIRGDGGYVVVPPSIHASGRKYQWVKGEGETPVYSRMDTAWTRETRENNSGPRPAFVRNEKGWIEEALKSLAPGNRDLPITRIVGKLHREGWQPGDIKALLAPNEEVQAHGLGELDRIIRSISAKPRGQENAGELPSDSFSGFMSNDTKVEWLVPGIIGRESLGFVAGLQETGKTWITMDLAVEVARGGLWLGKFPTNKAKVLFIDQERFHAETRRRLRAIMGAKAIGPAQLDGNLTVWCGTSIRLDLDNSFNALQRRMETLRPELVIVDSFATFHTKEENNRTDIQTVLERIKRLRQEFQCAFLFLDHEGKSVFHDETEKAPSAVQMVGSIGKPAAAELVLTVRKKGVNRSAVYHTKATLGQAVEPFVVEVNDVGGPDKIEVKAVGE